MARRDQQHTGSPWLYLSSVSVGEGGGESTAITDDVELNLDELLRLETKLFLVSHALTKKIATDEFTLFTTLTNCGISRDFILRSSAFNYS